MSLRLKLVLWYTGVFGASACVMVLTLHALVAHRLRSELHKLLEDEHEEWTRITREHGDDLRGLKRQIHAEIHGERYYPLVYRLHDTAAHRDVLVLASREIETSHQRALLAAAPIRGTPRQQELAALWVGKRPRPFFLLTGPVDLAHRPALTLQVAVYARRTEKRIESLREHLLLALGAFVLFAALSGWFLASRSLKPIDRIVADLGRIESQNLDERLAAGPARDEVARLRQAINRMLERLQAAFERLRHFTADAAHELRTPLAALQCRLEVALNKPSDEGDARDALSDALEQAAELSTLVGNLLLLARMDAQPTAANGQPVDFSALVADTCEPFALLAQQKGVALAVDAEDGLATAGDPVLLRQLLGNLLDNAVAYTPRGGRVRVEAARADDGCRLTVADTGIGIEQEALERVFDRFYRADPSRSRAEGGTGLGLSIVQRIVELHHGTIEVTSRPGQGTTVLVRLPQSEPATPGHDPPAET